VLDPLFKQAAAQGQSVFVSSGDQGAANLVFDQSSKMCVPASTRGVSEMSADPYVTSVGGTEAFAQFDQNGNVMGYAQEDAWNSDGCATGGGVSGVFTKPSYQTGPGVPNDGQRDVPDVALIASPSLPGVFLGDAVMGPASVVCCIGGTSLSSPMMAAMVDVIDQQVGRLGQFNNTLYNLANQQYAPSGPDNGFHDITIGDNTYPTGSSLIGYEATEGWDAPTGIGTPDAAILIPTLANMGYSNCWNNEEQNSLCSHNYDLNK
jgi:subtilase family serine protease